ncbi:kinase-like domain-containing protein [Rhizophagus clarus]|uniref:Kinase-like domain-containing protein n=1 Tax=Rhizophagus clarus TaxID=94130 RepID=A0A8H3LUJ1_9GLOM|nr:kinase-like domain-containing protein [Rhizophagus clarus]
MELQNLSQKIKSTRKKLFFTETWAIGQFNLGLNYGNGISVKKDLKMAAYWYEKAANNGHLKAMHNLAHLQYIKNMEADGNHQKAFELFEKPAEGNYAQC